MLVNNYVLDNKVDLNFLNNNIVYNITFPDKNCIESNLILDQSNDYNLKKKIKKFLPNIKYYKISSKNLGFAKGVNFLTSKVKIFISYQNQSTLNASLIHI